MLPGRVLRVLHHAFVIVLVVSTVAILSAQSVVDPRFVEFNASPDHNAMSSGVPIVERYWLSIYPVGSATAFATIDIGKPTPNASNVIRVDFLPLLPSAPAPNVTYDARVSAMGPGGTTASAVSNTFSFSPACTPAISPTSRTVSQSATTGTVALTLASGCAWSAVSNASWITLTGPTSGNGGANVGYSIAANSTLAQRVGTATIAGQTFTVTQAAGTCTYSISPTGQNVAAAGGSASTTVTASNSACAWTATSNATWLTVGTPSGTGSGPASFTAAVNPTLSQRSGTVTVAGRTFTVTQAANTCTYSISPTGQNVAAAGGGASTTVTASNSACAWTATSNATWLTVGTPSGTGSGPASFTAAVNPTLSQRSGTVTVAGQTFTVTQAANTCTYSISPTGQNVAAGGGPASTTITASDAACDWTAVSSDSWLTVTTPSGTGTGPASFNAEANPTTSQRTATVTVAGQTFTVSQAANTADCTYSISPASRTVTEDGGAVSTTVTASDASCVWTVVNNSPWVTVTTPSGTGSGTASFTAAANLTTSTRLATLTVAGRTFRIAQAAGTVGCTYSISPTSQTLPVGGGTFPTTVTTSNSTCAWNAISSSLWMTVVPTSGTGTGSISVTIAANPSTSQRTGSVNIGGQLLTVTQAGGCNYTISPTTRSVTAAAGSSNTYVTTTSTCAWTASTTASWITLTNTGRTGSGALAYSFTANTASAARTATITVANQTHTVTQAGTGTSTAPNAPSVPQNFRVSGSGGQ